MDSSDSFKIKFPDKDELGILKYSLLFALIFGLCAHAFAFFNLAPSHDYLFELISTKSSHDWQVSLGRFLEPLYHKATASSITTPWSIGLLGLLWLGLAAFITSNAFSLKNKWEIAAVAGIFVTNRTVTSLCATYMPWFGADVLSALAAVLAFDFWRCCTLTGRKVFLLCSAASLFVSLGLYQSYIALFVTLVMMFSIKELLEEKSFPAVSKNGILSICSAALGGALYAIGCKLSLWLTNVELTDGKYNSLTNLVQNSEGIAERVVNTYKEFILFFASEGTNIYPCTLMRLFNFMMLVFCIALFVHIVRKRKIKGRELALAIILVVLLPMGMNLIRLLNKSVHDLMIFACWLFYIIPVILLNIMKEEAPSLRLKALSLICAAFVLYSGIQTANVLYFKKSLEYDACLSLMSETQSKLESLPDYEAGVTPVIILGYPSDVLAPLEGFDRINEITGIGVKNSVISYYHGLYESYFKYVLQKEINLVEADEAVSDKAEAFPSYPKSGYVFELDGAAVVKFK